MGKCINCINVSLKYSQVVNKGGFKLHIDVNITYMQLDMLVVIWCLEQPIIVSFMPVISILQAVECTDSHILGGAGSVTFQTIYPPETLTHVYVYMHVYVEQTPLCGHWR